MKTILFDLDGTLTDPAEGILRSIQSALAEVGLPPVSDSELLTFIGPPLHDSFATLGADPDQVPLLVEAYRRRYREVGMFENSVYPGIPSVLDQLRSRGHVLHVTTSKPSPFANAILKHFDLIGFFSSVFGSNLDGSLADKTELLRFAQQSANFSSESTALVGDRVFDMTAARSLGLYSVGALWGYGSREELVSAGADALAESPADILSSLAA